MKTVEVLNTTTNSRVYNLAFSQLLKKKERRCWYCPPGGGCNFWKKKHYQRNWKQFRKTQWK